jgi:sirohydrochlorin ferrochelatase
VLLVGHGTREESGQSEFLAVARHVADRLAPLPVEPCFLELAAPSIGQGVQRLIDRGARRFVVAPTLLFAAGHANHDIPDAVTRACRDRGLPGGADEIVWEQAAHLGCHDAIIELSMRRESEALAERSAALGPSRRAKGPCVPNERMMRLLVGRGSCDARATQEMREFILRRSEAAGRGTRGDGGPLDACFLAMVEPRLPLALQRIAAQEPTCVLVQPHLLFTGLLTAEIRRCAAQMAQRRPEIEWIVAEPLGPDRLVVDALCDRVAATRMARAWGMADVRGARAAWGLQPPRAPDEPLSGKQPPHCAAGQDISIGRDGSVAMDCLRVADIA